MKTLKKSQQPIIILQGKKAAQALKHFNLADQKSEDRLTVSEGIEQWVNWLRKNDSANKTSQYRTYIQAWAESSNMGDKPISSVEEEDINKWVNEEGKLGTRRVKLAICRSFFKFLAIKEILGGPNPSLLATVDYNVMTHEEKESKQIQPLDEQQFFTLIKHFSDSLADLQKRLNNSTYDALTNKLLDKRHQVMFWWTAVVISRCTGLRFGDICQLEWKCFSGPQFTVWTDKRNRRVTPPIWNKELFDTVLDAIPPDDTTYCFPEERKAYMGVNTRPKLVMQFARLCEKLGLKGIRFHSLRHTYATDCFRKGVSMPHISMSLGHTSTATTQQYLH